MRSCLGILLLVGVVATVLLCAGSAQAVRLDMLTISPPADITTSANMPCGQTYCAQVYYTFTVTGGTPPYHLVCAPIDSGGLMVVGSHSVGCLAQDAHGNSTSTSTFTVTVTAYVHDVTPPVFQNVPGPLSGTADSSGRAVLYWPPVTATDDHDGPVAAHCQPSSGGGDAFTVGTTTVTCTAEDASANTATVSFTVTVNAAGVTETTTPVTTTAGTTTTTPAPPTTTAAGTTTTGVPTPPPPPPTTTVTQTMTQPMVPTKPPVANFTAVLIGHNRVKFTDASLRGSAAIAAHRWLFGDGSAASSLDPTHAYRARGAFYVSEITVDANGLTSVAVHELTLTTSKAVLGPRQSRITVKPAKPKVKSAGKKRAKHPTKAKKR